MKACWVERLPSQVWMWMCGGWCRANLGREEGFGIAVVVVQDFPREVEEEESVSFSKATLGILLAMVGYSEQ